MGDNGACKIACIGSVFLTTRTGCRLILRNARHVANVRLNLISIGRLDDEGHNGSFQYGMWKFCKGNLIVSRAQKQGTLYVMHAKLCEDEANMAADSDGELWNKRIGHMSKKGMHILADKKLLPDVKGVHLEKCVNCLAGKQNKAAFQSRLPKRREFALELVHMDVSYVDAQSHRCRVATRVRVEYGGTTGALD